MLRHWKGDELYLKGGIRFHESKCNDVNDVVGRMQGVL